MKSFWTICFSVFLSAYWASSGIAGQGKPEDFRFEIVSEGEYMISPKDTRTMYAALSLFEAKYKAVALGAKYLNHAGVLKDYGKSTKEIFSLAADDLTVDIIEQKHISPQKYHTRIKAVVTLASFTRAEVKDIALEKEESRFSWQQEMEQSLYQTVEPGKEISRAYRYVRKKERRQAIIYLDHLQKKYPNWQEVYFAKAIGFCALNQTKAMVKALKISCSLGNKEACGDVSGFSGIKSPLAP